MHYNVIYIYIYDINENPKKKQIEYDNKKGIFVLNDEN